MMKKLNFGVKRLKRFLPLLTAVAMVSGLVFMGCGGGGGGGGTTPPTEELTGTAAAGAPIVGTVNVRGGNGEVSFSAIESDGSYSVDVTSLEAPYIVWASGMANGKSVTLYSTCYELGNVNVTPATDMAMAMAVGQEPESYFAAADAQAPAQDNLDEAAQTVEDLLAIVFETLGIGDFDIMSGEFAADGSGFDELLDVVDMGVSEDGGSVQVVDTASETVLFQHDLGEPLPEITEADQNGVNDVINASLSILDQIRAILDTIAGLYAGTEAPTVEQLQTDLLPLMSDDFLESGLDAADTLESWADPVRDDGPPLGLTISNVAIARHMQSYTFGDNDPRTFDEKGGNYDGVWATFTAGSNGYTETASLKFVQPAEGAAWKWAGDGNPFMRGGHARVKAVNDYGNIYSGISLWTKDEGNLAMDRGIVRLLIFNPALPTVVDPVSGNTGNCIVMERTVPEVAEWRIVSTGALWQHIYTQTNGLDLSLLAGAPEFVFIALDDAGALVNGWVEELAALPISEATLSADPGAYFPTVLTVGGQPASESIPAGVLTGDVEITWRHPTTDGMMPSSVALALGTEGGYFRFGEENPAEDGSGQDPYAWNSATISVPYIGTASWASVDLDYDDRYERNFQLNYNLNVDQSLPSAIEIRGHWVQYCTHTHTERQGFRAWIAFKTAAGDLIAADDIAGITLSGPGGNVPIQDIGFYDAEYDQITMDEFPPTQEPVEQNRSFSGFNLVLADETVLGPGTYTFTAVTQSGQNLTTSYNYPGRVDLPVIDVSTMNASFNAGGDLVLSWTNPGNTGAYDQLRIRLYDGDVSPNELVFEAALSGTAKGMEEFVIPAAEIQEARETGDPEIVRWRIETRLRGDSGGYYARGQTSMQTIDGWSLSE